MKKLTKQQFEEATSIKTTDYGMFLETKGKNYHNQKYHFAQAFKGRGNFMDRYLNFYYPRYLAASKSKESTTIINCGA